MEFKLIRRLARDQLYKNSVSIASTHIFNAGCGFFFWMVAAKLYSIDEVGLATALISALGLVVLFSRLGFDFSIIRFFPTKDKGKVLRTSIIITTIASLLIGAIGILLVEHLSSSLIFLKNFDYALAFLIIVIANSVAYLTGMAFVADRKANHFLFQNVFMALRIPLLIPMTFLGTFGIFGSFGLSLFAASFFALIFLRSHLAPIRHGLDKEFLKQSFRFSSWNYISNILSVAPIMILPLLVLNLLGEAETGKYYIGFAIGNLVLTIPQSLSTSLFVEGSHGEGLKKSVMRAGIASFVFLIPAVFVLFLFGDKLLGLLGGEYVEAFSLLKLIALSSFLETIRVLFMSVRRVMMRVKILVILSALRCVLLLGLSYTFIQQYGLNGAGYGWIASCGVVALVIFWIAKRDAWF